jgi:hypothetical protein
LEKDEMFEELMQCPGLSNAYIKLYTGKKVQASTEEEGNVTNN